MLPLLPEIVVVLTVFTTLGLVTIVGFERLVTLRRHALDRFQRLLPYFLLVGGVLVINSLVRDVGPTLSWMIGWQITDTIFALEGGFVGWLQSHSHPIANTYFSYIYVYGYIFLLVFPVLAYFALSDDRPIRETFLAYALNYGIGVVCYLLFIAYGPRNVMPDLVDQVLYLHWPESHLLTSEVNANVNVFPSLHTSVSATVALLAFRSRDEYPLWTPVAVLLAISIIVSTMYLGIHWLVDVIAGLVLAVISVAAAAWLTSPARKHSKIHSYGVRLRAPIDYTTQLLADWVRERRRSRRDPSQTGDSPPDGN